MQFIRDIHAAAAGKRPVISFEFFPPKTEEGDRALLQRTIPALMRLRPDYCSVTYGAGGTSRTHPGVYSGYDVEVGEYPAWVAHSALVSGSG